MSVIFDISETCIFDQAFVEDESNESNVTHESNENDNTFIVSPNIPTTQNVLDTSNEEEEIQVNVIQSIDDIDIEIEAAKEETSAGIIANSLSTILMMSDEVSRQATFHQFSSSNHVCFSVKLEKCFDQVQKTNLDRVLKTKMKSDVWMREEADRSQAFLRLYRLRRGENTQEFEAISGENTKEFEAISGENTKEFEAISGENTQEFEAISGENTKEFEAISGENTKEFEAISGENTQEFEAIS